jgi:hypothetical protein
MQAHKGRVTKVGKVSGKQIEKKKKVFIFFLSNGLSFKYDFCVIITPKP